jgi:hypothetical protein
MIALIQRHLEAIYDVEAPDVRDFLVQEAEVQALVGPSRPAREWVLVRQADEGVYIHDDDLAAVAARTPPEAVRDVLPAFCNVTEGVSHFLLLVRRAARGETVSLLELETQAEVDKYVTARLHGEDRRSGGPELRRRLYRDATLAAGLDADEQARYTAAGRMADRYCEGLERLRDVDALLGELRRFYRLPGHARMQRLRRAA